MECNVWKICKARKMFYITHPWRWIKDTALSLKWAYQRATKGYADVDWFNLCDWMIEVLSKMFDEYANNRCGYPGEEAGFTDEQWTEYLHSIASHMRNASEDQEVQKNEYEESWSEMSDDRWDQLKRWEDKDGRIHYEWPPLSDGKKDIREKYFAREQEIYQWRLSEAQTALKMIGDQFFSLWD